MGIELFFIAIGLPMDAFAVSVCKGLSTQGNCPDWDKHDPGGCIGKENTDASLNPKIMFPAAIATSIDAFAVGVTLAALQVHIILAVLLILTELY